MVTYVKVLRPFFPLEPRVFTHHKDRTPPVLPPKIDRSGRIKQRTLEFFLIFPGWHKPSELTSDPYLEVIYESPGISRKIQMRLTRYYRQGLLSRRRAPRGFEYSIAKAGEDRLRYFWEKFGESEIDDALTPEEEKLRVEKISQMVKNLDKRIAYFSTMLSHKNAVKEADANEAFSSTIDQEKSTLPGHDASFVSPEQASDQLFLLPWKKNDAGANSVPLEHLPPHITEYIKSNGWFNGQNQFYALNIGDYWFLLTGKELLLTR
jgi:hypothetical protein